MDSEENNLEPEKIVDMVVKFDDSSKDHDLTCPAKVPLKAKLKEVLVECAQRSTIHSVPSIAAPRMKVLIRGLWILCFSISCLSFFYLSAGLVKDFLDLKVKTITYKRFEQQATFPGNFLIL